MTDSNANNDAQKIDDVAASAMPLLDHLTELRNRLGLCVLVFLGLLIACLIRPFGQDSNTIADIVYLFLQRPLADILQEQGGRMIFTALHEAFFTQIKVAFFPVFFLIIFLDNR